MLPITQDIIQKATALRHDLHQHPELSGFEFETQRRIITWLKNEGLNPTPIMGTGVKVELEGTAPGNSDRYVLLRADIDALPVVEATGAEFSSKIIAAMHACGHDTHAAMLAAALVILYQNQHAWSGKVRGIFQPAEETNTHTTDLVGDGVITHDLTRAFALHVLPNLPKGHVNLMEGPVMSGSKRFQITFDGPGGHGGNPHLGSDGIVAAADFINAIQTIVSRRLETKQMAVISLGKLEAGTAWNVLAGHVVMGGSARFFDDAIGDTIIQELNRIARSTAERFQMVSDITVATSIPPVINHPDVVAVLTRGISDAEGLSLIDMEPLTVSEDYSRYLEHVPGVMAYLGTGDSDDPRTKKPLHDASFLPLDEIIPNGIKLHLIAATQD